MLSETSVAAALWVRGVEVPATGVPFEEPPLPEVRCAVRTVDGVAGERPPTPCCARGVVLAPLSTLTCRFRGVVSRLSLSARRRGVDLGVVSWPLLSFCRGTDLLAVFARLRVGGVECACVDGSVSGGASAALLLLCRLGILGGVRGLVAGSDLPPAACGVFCATGSGLAMPPTRGVPSQLLRFIMRPRIPTSSAASSNSVSSIASCAR